MFTVLAIRRYGVTVSDDLYDVARQVTDEVLGEGAYATTNAGSLNPGVQAAIARGPVSTHAAVPAEPTEEWRELVRRSADLCRRNPAAFAASVRLSDYLQQRGMDRLSARRTALREHDPVGG